MSANANDLLRKSKSLFATTLASSIDDTTQTIPCNSLSGLPTDTAVTLTIDRAGTREVVTGVVSTNSLINCKRGEDGTSGASHASGATVEAIWDAEGLNDLITGLLVEHNQLTGVHTSALVTTLKAAGSDVTAGTSDLKIVTPKALADANIGGDWKTAGTFTYASSDAPTYVVTVASGAASIYAVGMRVKLTDVTVKYFIITAVADTALTLYGGTDYTLSGGAISSPYYSSVKCPLGFPVSPIKWTVETSDTTERTQASPTQNTWYNLGSVSITIPIGLWRVCWNAVVGSDVGSIAQQVVASTLSTANNSESDVDYTAYVSVNTVSFNANLTREKDLLLASKTAYYFNTKTFQSGSSHINNLNDKSKLFIRATCLYL